MRLWSLGLLVLAPTLAWAHPCKLKPLVPRKPAVSEPAKPGEVGWPVVTRAELVRAKGGFRKGNAVPVGQRARHGIAEMLFDAPPEAVLQAARRYEDYASFSPRKFKSSQAIAHHPDGNSDVYMQILAGHGALRLWLVMQFSPVTIDPKSQVRVFEGRYLEGNLSDAHVRVIVASAGQGQSYARVELLAELPVFVPQEMIDEELRDAAADALRGIAKGLTRASP